MQPALNTLGLNRRQGLQLGLLGLGGFGVGGMGLTLPDLLHADQHSPVRATADSCVLLFLNGGPSHLDMWDMKPDAPDGIRGEFKPIASSLPGYSVSEHLPHLAQWMHRSLVVRSMHHSVNNSHAAAVYASLTGHDRGEIGGGARPDDHPSLGSVLSRLRPVSRQVFPHVHLPYITKEGAGGPPQPGFFGGILGRATDPLFVLKNPNEPDFRIPELSPSTEVSEERLSRRRGLMSLLGEPPTAGTAGGEMLAMQERALDILTSAQTQRAFRLTEEAADVRERYGRNIYGQSVLLARRLVEAGTRVVTISWAPDANATWDTHGSNFRSLQSTLLPQLDLAAASLIGDLHERGLLDRTLVAIFGDFGRTPKINANNGGRDHWNFCYSLMLVGGGLKGGLIYGSSDKIGAFPNSNPLVPGDIIATIYQALGVSHEAEIYDSQNRPHRLVPAGVVQADFFA
ncbi:MAG: DUF1501 domain-containing protein [Planctomycetaceae bacterium]|jgi:hypothetical protein